MTNFVSIIGILFCLHFVSFPCQGKISLPPGGDTIVVVPGTAKVEIAWDFDDTITAGTARRWNFVTKNEPLAVIFGTGSSVTKLSSLLEFEIEDKATLVLKNVNSSYNGTYEFLINHGVNPEISRVSVFIAGKISLPPGGDTIVVVPGTARVEIAWDFDDTITAGTARRWNFVTKNEPLAVLFGTGSSVTKLSSLLEFEIKDKATLVLKNVNSSYNGTYEFSIQHVVTPERSRVSVFIAAKPSAIKNCSNPRIVNKGDDVRCLCEGEGGNPPAKVTWYKNGKQFGVAGDKEKMLVLNNVDKTDSGTYQCVARSYTLKNEKSIEVIVHYKSKDTKIKFSQNPVNLTNQVIISCEADGLPEPSYAIVHNGTEFFPTKTRTIESVKYSDGGSYKCFANNTLGNASSETKDLNVTGSYEISTIGTTKITNAANNKKSTTEREACSKSGCGTEWYVIFVTLVSGIIIGILLSYFFSYFRRRFQDRKPDSNPKLETAKVNSIYQDLDLAKMSPEDDYQSLRVNSGRNEADYENQNDSTYTELNRMRDVENNYQSLT